MKYWLCETILRTCQKYIGYVRFFVSAKVYQFFFYKIQLSIILILRKMDCHVIINIFCQLSMSLETKNLTYDNVRKNGIWSSRCAIVYYRHDIMKKFQSKRNTIIQYTPPFSQVCAMKFCNISIVAELRYSKFRGTGSFWYWYYIKYHRLKTLAR